MARPADGTPIVLEPIAAIVWASLADRSDEATLKHVLSGRYPAIPPGDRDATLAEILDGLEEEGLLERSA